LSPNIDRDFSAASKMAWASILWRATAISTAGHSQTIATSPDGGSGETQVQRLMAQAGIQGAKRRGKPWRTTISDSEARSGHRGHLTADC
jgi:hypothetical protein